MKHDTRLLHLPQHVYTKLQAAARKQGVSASRLLEQLASDLPAQNGKN